MFQGSYGAAVALFVHDAGVERMLALGRVDGPFARIEQRIVLQRPHHFFAGVHCGAALGKHFLAEGAVYLTNCSLGPGNAIPPGDLNAE